MLLGFAYAIVGLLSCYTALIIVNVYEWDWDSNPMCYFYPIGSILLWPITVPGTFIFFFVNFMNKSSETIAKRIKNRKK